MWIESSIADHLLARLAGQDVDDNLLDLRSNERSRSAPARKVLPGTDELRAVLSHEPLEGGICPKNIATLFGDPPSGGLVLAQTSWCRCIHVDKPQKDAGHGEALRITQYND